MSVDIIIDVTLNETRVARLENREVVEAYVERSASHSFIGNIYKGKVERVLPGMQAAFVDIGLNRTAFLHAKNIINREDIEKKSIKDEEFNHEFETEQVTDVVRDEPISITDLIKEGDLILVQVIKDPLGAKGAQISGHISVPGRYLVFLPGSSHLGVSNRIEDSSERERLKDLVSKHKGSNVGGFIVRTVAEGIFEKHIKEDMDYLLKQWSFIKKNADKTKKISLIHNDLSIASKIIRDRVTEDVNKIIVNDESKFKKLQKFAQNFMPKLKKKIEIYADQIPLFEFYNIEKDLQRALEKKVWLKSGGYIIFDQTEALISIDVNTGSFVGKRNLEDTILQTNLEAVKEIAYQIRLRNLGGIIVVDFIDMKKVEDRERLFLAFNEEISKDPVKTNVYPISKLGLVEMSRKRTRDSLWGHQTQMCSNCEGRGFVKSLGVISYDLFRECIKEKNTIPGSSVIMVYCHPKIAEFITSVEAESLRSLEKNLGCKVIIKDDSSLHIEESEVFSKEE